jgi:hypothetical protein
MGDKPKQLALVAEAQRTILSLSIVARSVKAPGPDLVERLSKALEGPLLPAASGDIARDTEFELTVAGLMTMGGVGVGLGGPDAIAAYPDGDVGLAAKRISSLAKVRRRISKGVKQLAKDGGRGFVVLNVERQLADVAPTDDVLKASEAVFDEAKRQAEAVYRSRTDPSPFIGIIGIGFQVTWDLGKVPPMSGIELFLRMHVVSKDPSDRAVARIFWDHLSANIDARIPTI